MPREPKPGEQEGQISEPIRTYAADSGLVMRSPSLVPNTMYILEATEYAQQQGKFGPFHHAAYEALWGEGKNLGDLSVIQELAEKCDLNWAELAPLLESGFYRPVVVNQYNQARGLGFQGIPAFLVGNLRFTGAQPYQMFQLAVKRALEGVE